MHFLYACLKGMKMSKCNKAKAKYIILITHVPQLFKQYQGLAILNGIFSP